MAPKKREPLCQLDLIVSEQREYLVKNLFPRRGLAIVWGPPKCGKSFWVFTVMLHIALGRDYRGHRVQQGEIAYLALEGQSGFGNRAEAFRLWHLEDEPNEPIPAFRLCGANLDLIKDHTKLITDIERQAATPAAVVIDTLNRSLVGSEGKDEDMAAYLKAAEAIQNAFQCLVIIIHHCGVSGDRPRGHTSQTGAADVQIEVRKDASGNVLATVELAKDMAEGTTFASRLEVIELGTDQDGDQITSCAVVPVEGVTGKRAPKGQSMSKAGKTALRALREAIDELGAIPPASNHIPAKTKTVSIAHWRQYAYRLGISTSDEDRAKRQAFQRASENLIGGEHVAVWNDEAWPTR